ncbi:septal ring lytic transglycosylase RlpA family protein [Xanthobacter agilis]|nr:septal ring lytic transglycosylase RlpA family protein [Xanthobacter agilis]
MAGCSAVDSKLDPTYGVEVSPRVVAAGQPVPKGGGRYKVGKPYQVAGQTYVPAEDPNYVAEGTASWYGRDFHGRMTANGEVFDMASISVAHRTLPMPSYVRVTNLANNRSIIARVNNRGPYARGRLVDVSYKTAELLGFAKFGVARVRVEYVGRAPLDGSDDTKLAMTLQQDGTPARAPAESGVMVASAKPFIPEVPEAVPSSVAEAPLPLSRPYDLGAGGETEVASAEDEGPVQAAAQPAPSKPKTASNASKPVAAKPASKPAQTHVAESTTQVRSPSAVAATVPQPRPVSVATNGWSTGPAPVSGLGFAGVSRNGN